MDDVFQLLLGVLLLILAFEAGMGHRGRQVLRMVQVAALALTLRCAVQYFLLDPDLSAGPGLTGALIVLCLALVAVLSLFSAHWRRWLELRLRAAGAGFQAESARHQAALTLMAAVVLCSLSLAAASGAEYDPWDLEALFMSMTLMLALALAGIGFPARRNVAQARHRLGLQAPGVRGLLLAAGVGLLLVSLMSLLWLLLAVFTWPQFADDAGGLAAPGLNVALLSALMSALGEETMFRGVLQPVFGAIPTSICFALLHARPGAEIAALPVFAVSLVLAWLRRRHGTLAAICAHFSYNFILTLTLPWYVL